MMRILCMASILLLRLNSTAQELSASIAYTGFHSPGLSNILQAYNFSRPFLVNKQPLLRHGASASCSILSKSTDSFKQGIQISYAFFSSVSQNQALTNRLNLHLYEFNYLIYRLNPLGFSKLFAQAGAGITASALFRRVNNHPFFVDNKRTGSAGLGLNLSATIGYLGPKQHAARGVPFCTIRYVPLLFAPHNESIINGTRTMIGSGRFSALTLGIGCTFYPGKRSAMNNAGAKTPPPRSD